jgi:hypothetical protein
MTVKPLTFRLTPNKTVELVFENIGGWAIGYFG